MKMGDRGAERTVKPKLDVASPGHLAFWGSDKLLCRYQKDCHVTYHACPCGESARPASPFEESIGQRRLVDYPLAFGGKLSLISHEKLSHFSHLRNLVHAGMNRWVVEGKVKGPQTGSYFALADGSPPLIAKAS
jgi:hypothetical protein